MRTLYFPLQAVLKTDDDLQLSSRFLSLFSFQGAIAFRRNLCEALDALCEDLGSAHFQFETSVPSVFLPCLPDLLLTAFCPSGFLRIQIPETNLS